MDKNQFPQYLSAPLQIMWFSADEFTILVIFLVIFLIFGGWSAALIFLGPFTYRQLINRYSSSFLVHAIYFTGFKKFSHYPNSFENEFQE